MALGRLAMVAGCIVGGIAFQAASVGGLLYSQRATLIVSVPATRLEARATLAGGPQGGDIQTILVDAHVTETRQGTASSIVIPTNPRACTAGQWVVTARSFRVIRIGTPSKKHSDWFTAITKQDLARTVQEQTAHARAENDSTAKRIIGWQADCNAGGCGSAVVGPPPGDPEPPGNY